MKDLDRVMVWRIRLGSKIEGLGKQAEMQAEIQQAITRSLRESERRWM